MEIKIKAMKVWKLEIFDSEMIFTNLKDLTDSIHCELEDVEELEVIVITPIEMTEDEYSKLPEFDGH